MSLPQVPLAKEIVQRNSKGLPVHRVPDAEDFSFGARTFLMEHGVVEVAPQGWEGRSGDDMDFFEIE